MMRCRNFSEVRVVGCLLGVCVLAAAAADARPKPVTIEYQWKAMIVEGTWSDGQCQDLPYPPTLTSGREATGFETVTVGYEAYCGHLYTGGDDTRISVGWTNRQWSVFGFHIDPGDSESFMFSRLDISEALFDNFNRGSLPCDGESDLECVEDFLNGVHPKGDFYNVGFAFRSSPYQCDFKWDEQPVGSSAQVAVSLWLEADEWQSSVCPKGTYNVVGSLDPGAGCDCETLYHPETSSVTRLDENHWIVAVDNAVIENLHALDCEIVQLNKNRTRWVGLRPMDDGVVGPFTFEILFIREPVK